MTLASQRNPEFQGLTDEKISQMWEKNRQERRELVRLLDNSDFGSEEAKDIEQKLDLNDLASFTIENELCARNLDY